MSHDRSAWIVPDDFAVRFMTNEAQFCAREAIEARKRGCEEYVIEHYQRRSDLLRDAAARLKGAEVAL